MSERENIIAGGPLPLPPEERNRRWHELHRQLSAQYAAEIARAYWLGCIRIWFRIQREISARLEPRRSPHALYHTSSRN